MTGLNEMKLPIPKHLEELVRPTPGSIAKLSAAWDGLSVETQIIILDYHVSNNPSDSIIDVCKLAIRSSNEYVQYLGVKYGFRLDDAIKEFVIVSNNSLLAVFKNAYLNCRIDPAYLFRLDQSERLMLISRKREITIFVLENILEYFYNSSVRNTVSNKELEDIVWEFMGNTYIMDGSDSWDVFRIINRMEDVCHKEIISIIRENW